MNQTQRREWEQSTLGDDDPPEPPIKVEGRFPSGELANFPPRLNPDKIVVTEDVWPDGEGVTLKIDDESQPDFWMQIGIPREYLAKLFRRVSEGEFRNTESEDRRLREALQKVVKAGIDNLPEAAGEQS